MVWSTPSTVTDTGVLFIPNTVTVSSTGNVPVYCYKKKINTHTVHKYSVVILIDSCVYYDMFMWFV